MGDLRLLPRSLRRQLHQRRRASNARWREPLYPPSRCPTCGGRLRFFRENLPILGWLTLRGRCRLCGVRISPWYALIELGMAMAFLGLYVIFFWISFQDPWWGEVAGRWWSLQQFLRAWPAWICIAFMLAGALRNDRDRCQNLHDSTGDSRIHHRHGFHALARAGAARQDTGMVERLTVANSRSRVDPVATRTGRCPGSRGGVLPAVDRTIEIQLFRLRRLCGAW